jgi:heme/copper-type cytochrome/quinol oxidase subunit 2
MQNALGLMSDQVIMIAITLGLALCGIAALFLALLWPPRWRLKYRMEIGFVAVLVVLVVYADLNSARTYATYESDLLTAGPVSGKVTGPAAAGGFDRSIRVFAFQWGFVFLDEQGAASRNAVQVLPDQKILFTIFSNDVIHGFNIPAARITTELEPGDSRAIWIRAPKAPGKYLIQCMNYCGLGHAQMKAWLVVGNGGEEHPPDAVHG